MFLRWCRWIRSGADGLEVVQQFRGGADGLEVVQMVQDGAGDLEGMQMVQRWCMSLRGGAEGLEVEKTVVQMRVKFIFLTVYTFIDEYQKDRFSIQSYHFLRVSFFILYVGRYITDPVKDMSGEAISEKKYTFRSEV